MLRSLLPPALAATVVLAGCAGTPSSGSSSTTKFKGDERLVANTVEDLETSSRPGRTDPGKICRDVLAAPLAQKFATAGGTCSKGVDSALKDADAYQLAVQDVAIQGNAATAKVKVDTGDRDRIQTVALAKEAGSPTAGWRISRFP
ncbi:MAG: hypothetical protein ABI950_05785 [Solirubrobacteraceae bacterium]